MPDTSAERQESLDAAVALHQNIWECDHDAAPLLRTASAIYDWLTAPVTLVITLGPAVDQTTGKSTGNPGGSPMKDTEKAQLTVTGSDAKQQPTTVGTDITFTSADTTIATIVTDATGTWVVAGNPGSTVVTADWPDSPNGDLAGTVAVDVTAGNATSLQISLGAPVAQ